MYFIITDKLKWQVTDYSVRENKNKIEHVLGYSKEFNKLEELDADTALDYIEALAILYWDFESDIKIYYDDVELDYFKVLTE